MAAIDVLEKTLAALARPRVIQGVVRAERRRFRIYHTLTVVFFAFAAASVLAGCGRHAPAVPESNAPTNALSVAAPADESTAPAPSNASPDPLKETTGDGNAGAQPASEPIPGEPVIWTIDEWKVGGAKFSENPDGTIKVADFSGAAEPGAFRPSEINRIKSLRVVKGKGPLTDQLANQCTECSALTEFLWVDTKLSENALASLAAPQSLKKLRLNGLQGTPKTTLVISEFPALAELDISGSSIGDADLAPLAGMKTLKSLNLYQTKVTDAGVKELLPIAEQLTWLNLDATGVTDASGPELERFTNLKFLHLGRTEITDDIIPSLAKLTKLETIHVTRTKLTEEGAERLRSMLPDTKVVSVVEEKP